MQKTKKSVLGIGFIVASAALAIPAVTATSASASTVAVAHASGGSPAGASSGLLGLLGLGGILGPVASAVPGLGGSGSIATSPSTVAENDMGGVSFAVSGTGLPASMPLTLASTDLSTACRGGTNLATLKVMTDFNGSFNAVVAGADCEPGTYTVQAAEGSSPFQTYATTVTLQAP